MDLSPVIQRLKDTQSGYAQIGGTADLDAALASSVRTPSLFVMLLANSGTPSRTTGRHSQQIGAEFCVILALPNSRGKVTDTGGGDLHQARMALWHGLLGWSDGQIDPINFLSGRLLQSNSSTLWWVDEFKTGYSWTHSG